MINFNNKELMRNVIESYNTYGKAFKEGEYNSQYFINAAFIAFLAQDYGFASEHNLPNEFIESCNKDMYFMLDEGKSLFPNEQLHFDFWIKYFKHILEDDYEPDFSYYFDSGVIEAGIWAEEIDYDFRKELERNSSFKNRYLISML